jgi:hypothetical protein
MSGVDLRLVKEAKLRLEIQSNLYEIKLTLNLNVTIFILTLYSEV